MFFRLRPQAPLFRIADRRIIIGDSLSRRVLTHTLFDRSQSVIRDYPRNTSFNEVVQPCGKNFDQKSSYATSNQRRKKNRAEPPLKPKKNLIKAITKQLSPHENIYTIPNILSFSRLIAAPVIGLFVLNDQHIWAISLLAYASTTDLVDGWIARRWNLQTVVGSVIDPMADKALMTVLTVCLAVKGALPIWLAGIILGRDIGLAITAVYYRWISLPPPKTFTRYWDFSLPSAEVHPTTISKYNTALQLALVGATTAMPVLTIDIDAAMSIMHYVVATTTIWSGASYIYSRDVVKILRHKKPK
ncbi:hypothetical protein K3495_g2246 [Podosphaera aphanis]|nr:hypothetical protein K3495_g2246 [Podosphaera aphanis]